LGVPIVEHGIYPAGMGLLVEHTTTWTQAELPREFPPALLPKFPQPPGPQPRFILDWRSGTMEFFRV
jgi:hypothetical protein